MNKITAGEYFEKNVVWNGTVIMNPISLMEGYHQYLEGVLDDNENIIK